MYVRTYVRMYVNARMCVCVGVLLVNSNIKYYCRNKYIQYIYLSTWAAQGWKTQQASPTLRPAQKAAEASVTAAFL